MCSTIARLASRSRQRTGSSSTESKSATVSLSRGWAWTDPIWMTCERISTPTARRNALASAPPATRAAVSRARALEDVAHVARAVLPRADEVGVARARQVHLGHLGLDRPRVHPLLPVGEVAVLHLQRDRAAERAPVADAGGDLRAVALDLHPSAAAVAQLAAGHVAVDRLAVELEAGGQALDDAREAGPVRLAGRDELECGAHVRAPQCMALGPTSSSASARPGCPAAACDPAARCPGPGRPRPRPSRSHAGAWPA